MKRILPALMLSFCFLTACDFAQENTAPAEPAVPPILVIDQAIIFRDSEPGKAGLAFLEEIQARMQAELVILQGQMQADPENTELQSVAYALYTEFQQQITLEEQNVLNILQTLLNEKVQEYRIEKGASVILGSDFIFAYDEALDVTADLIAKMDTEEVTYTSVLDPQPAEEATEEATEETTEEESSEEATEENSEEEVAEEADEEEATEENAEENNEAE